MNSEEFTNDFINSIRDDEGSSFKQIYRNVDVLLIDDIQFLAGKEATMEEFFHTFNALYNHQKQIVITSDLPPKQLTGFAERMRSRFGSGLNVDVQPRSWRPASRFCERRLRARFCRCAMTLWNTLLPMSRPIFASWRAL